MGWRVCVFVTVHFKCIPMYRLCKHIKRANSLCVQLTFIDKIACLSSNLIAMHTLWHCINMLFIHLDFRQWFEYKMGERERESKSDEERDTQNTSTRSQISCNCYFFRCPSPVVNANDGRKEDRRSEREWDSKNIF